MRFSCRALPGTSHKYDNALCVRRYARIYNSQQPLLRALILSADVTIATVSLLVKGPCYIDDGT